MSEQDATIVVRPNSELGEMVREEFAPLVAGIRLTKDGKVMLDISPLMIKTLGHQTYLQVLGAASELEHEIRQAAKGIT
jgi:hypothetical protein